MSLPTLQPATITGPAVASSPSSDQPAQNLQYLFLCRLKSCKYVFKTGKEAHFVDGQFTTNIPEEVEQLNAEVRAGHPHIHTDINRVQVDVTKRDPMVALREKIIAEYKASLAAAVNPNNDAGNYDTGKLQGISNSQTVSDAMGASNSTGGGLGVVGDSAPAPTAKLTSLKASK